MGNLNQTLSQYIILGEEEEEEVKKNFPTPYSKLEPHTVINNLYYNSHIFMILKPFIFNII